MLTKSDLGEIAKITEKVSRQVVQEVVSNELSDFAILMKQQFDRIELNKADKTDIARLEKKIDGLDSSKADKTDILRLESHLLERTNRI